MKKLRVFPTVKRKRIVSGFPLRNPGTILLFCLLVPYLIASLFGNIEGTGQTAKQGDESEGVEAVEALSRGGSLTEGNWYVNNQTAIGREQIPLELYVADLLARTMEEDYEPEALKAQAVLIRSNLYFQREQESETAKSGRSIRLEDKKYGSTRISDKARQAVLQTAGVYLAYEDKPAAAPYFQVSNGATRSAQDLDLKEYPYLKSVACERDFLSEDYNSSVRLSRKKLDSLWEQLSDCKIEEERLQELKREEIGCIPGMRLYRDAAGYVLYVQIDEKCVLGEDFRNSLQLSSASFHPEEEGEEIRFFCKGAGHGLGMSQFGANQMAMKGKNYIDIVKYFFQDATITKIE